MNRFLKLFLVTLPFVIAFIAAINIYKINQYKDKIALQVETFFSAKIVVGSGMSLRFFGISLHDVKIIQYSDNSLSNIKNLDIGFEKIPLLFFKIKVNSIKLRDGQVDMKHLSFNSTTIPYEILLQNIRFKISSLLIDMNIQDARYIASGKKTELSGTVIGNKDRVYNLSVIKNHVDDQFFVQLLTSTDRIDISLGKTINKISGHGTNLLAITNDFTILNQSSNSESNFAIEGALDNTTGDFNMELKSNFLHFIAKSKRVDDMLNLILESKNLNLDLLKFNHFLGADLTEYFSYIIPPSINSLIKVNFDSIKFNEKNINNFFSRIVIKDSKINIEQINANLPGGLNLSLDGQIQDEVAFSKFDGNFYIDGHLSDEFLNWINMKDELATEGGDISIKSRLIIAPQMLILSNLDFSLPFFSGSASLNYKLNIAERKFRGGVKVKNFNFDNQLLLKEISKKLVTLNSFNSNLEVNLENSSINNQKVRRIDLHLNSENGNGFAFFEFDSQNANFKGRMHLNGIDKKIDLKIAGKYLDAEILNFPKLLTIKKNGEKTEVLWNVNKIHNVDENGSANLEISLDAFKPKNDDELITSLIVNASFENSIISINKLSFDKGRMAFDLVCSAGVGQNSNSFKTSFNIKNFDASNLLNNILELEYISGYFSIAGELSSHGESVNDLIKNLSGVINTEGSEVAIKGVDFNILSSQLQDVLSMQQLDPITRIKVFSGNTTFRSMGGSTNVKNGVAATSLKFITDTTSGLISSNLSLANMETNTVAKIFFVAPKWGNQVADVDMNIQGSIWKPKIFFNNEKIYKMIQEKLQETKNEI